MKPIRPVSGLTSVDLHYLPIMLTVVHSEVTRLPLRGQCRIFTDFPFTERLREIRAQPLYINAGLAMKRVSLGRNRYYPQPGP